MTVHDTGAISASLRGWMGISWLIAAAVAGTAVGLLTIRVGSPLLAIAAVVGLLGSAIVVAKPEIGLLALVFVTFTSLSEVLIRHVGAPLTLMKLLVPLVGLAVLAQWFWQRFPPVGWRRPATLVALYCLAGVLSLPAAVDPSRTIDGLSDLIKDGIVLILVVVLIRRLATLRRVFWTLLVAGLLMGTISVHQYLTGNFASDYGGFALEPVTWGGAGEAVHRVAGPVGNPNSYGMILLFFIPVAIDRLMNPGRLTPRLAALCTLVVCALSIVFTYSRGAFVAMILIVLSVMIIRRPRPRHVLIALTVAALLSPLVPSSYVDRVASLVHVVQRPQETIGFRDSSLRGRFSENLAAVQMFGDHPLTGVGLGNYPFRYQDYSQELMLDPRSTERAAHNLYLEIASETGTVGLVAFGAVLWFLFRSLRDARRSLIDPRLAELRGMVHAVTIALIGYLGGSLFLHATHMRYFWVLAGIAFALPHVAAAEGERVALEQRRSRLVGAGA